MIFAEMEYPGRYQDFHAQLGVHLERHFPHLQSGLQVDSWFWVFGPGEKVAIDTFSSMRHQIKSAKAGPLVQQVIEVLQLKFKVNVYKRPEPEGHE